MSISASIGSPLVLNCSGSVLQAGLASDPQPVDIPASEYPGSIVCRRFYNFKELEELIVAVYHRLSIIPFEHPLIIVDAFPAPRLLREMFTQVAFERLSAPGILFVSAPVASVYDASSPNAITVDVGRSSTSVIPVIGGVPHTVGSAEAVGLDALRAFATALLAHHTHDPSVMNSSGSAEASSANPDDTIAELSATVVAVAFSGTAPPPAVPPRVADIVREYLFDPLGAVNRAMREGVGSCARSGPSDAATRAKLLAPAASHGHVGLAFALRNLVTTMPFDMRSRITTIVPLGALADGNAFVKRLSAVGISVGIPRASPRSAAIGGAGGAVGAADGGSGDVAVSRVDGCVTLPASVATAVWRGAATLAVLPVCEDLWTTKAMYDDEGPPAVHRVGFS